MMMLKKINDTIIVSHISNIPFAEYCAIDYESVTSRFYFDQVEILETERENASASEGLGLDTVDDISDTGSDMPESPLSNTLSAVESVQRYMRSQDNAANAICGLKNAQKLFSLKIYELLNKNKF